MKDFIFKYIIVGLSLVPSVNFATGSASAIINLSDCQSCHTGNLGIPKDMAFALEDPENNFAAVTQYEPGKTYRIHLRFQPVGGANMVGFKLGAQFRDLQKAGTISDPPIGNFERSSDDSTVAAYIDANLPAEIADLYMEWEAPESEDIVEFSLDRVEANGNGANSGDRGNSLTEKFRILGPGGNNLPNEDDEPTDEELDANPTNNTTQSTIDQTAFGENFAGGCASIHTANVPLKNTELGLWILLGGFLLILWARKLKKSYQ